VSWECRHKSGDLCNKLGVRCDPGRKGCVLYGKVYFPFSPEKNPPSMRESWDEKDSRKDAKPGDAPNSR